MPYIIGVKFRNGGKSYYFTPGNHAVKQGDAVVVETSRGTELGTVSFDLGEVELENSEMQIKEIVRKATNEDVERAAENRRKEKEAYAVGQEKILSHGLDMKLIDVEYTFDNNKILFYFTADGRIDFRELVKDLASVFRTRIELRQIGVRDETKMLGGMGICGRPLCCHSYLADFVPVSIKMAKEQGLSLNPGKISGVCGRLMCCLKNEEEVYEEINARMPSQGDGVVSKDGLRGEVANVNVLRETVRVLVENGDEKEFHEVKVSDLVEVEPRRRRGAKSRNNKEKESKLLAGADTEPVNESDLTELEQEEEKDKAEGIAEHKEQDGIKREHAPHESGGRRHSGRKNRGGADRHEWQPGDETGEHRQQTGRRDRGGSANLRHTRGSGKAPRDENRKDAAPRGIGAHGGAGRDRNYRHRGPRKFTPNQTGVNADMTNGQGGTYPNESFGAGGGDNLS